MANSVVKFLGSAKLAIALFFVLAVLSIIGTLIPQGQLLDFYIAKYGNSMGQIIRLFQLDDAYHSPWYVAALFLFLINLSICSLNRFPFTYKLFKRNPEDIKPENLPSKITIQSSKSIEQIAKDLEKNLKFSKVTEGLYYKKESNWSHFSVYIVHASLLIITVGALIGALLGFRGNLSLLEGEQSNIVQPFRKKDQVQLDFNVKLNKFIIETYPNGMVKEYISNVTFIDGNNTVDAIIKVNDPVKFKDVTFYQASYEVIPVFDFKFTINDKIYESSLNRFEPYQSEDDDVSIAISDYGQAHGLIFVRLWMFSEKTQVTKEAIALMSKDQRPEFEMSPMLCFGGVHGLSPCDSVDLGGVKVKAELKGVADEMYLSVLQAKIDPGRYVVYLGFILMMLGLFFVYYLEPKIYWIYLYRTENSTTLTLGAYAKRDREGIRLKIQELAERLV